MGENQVPFVGTAPLGGVPAAKVAVAKADKAKKLAAAKAKTKKKGA